METESSSVTVPVRPWDELIPDALGLIFKQLPLQQVLTVIPRVCKSWRRAVEGPYCWQVIDIAQWSKQCGPVRLDRMLRMLVSRAGGSLRELHVSHVHDYWTFCFIAEKASSLRALHFRWSEILDSVISQHTHHFSNLTTLDLSYCRNVSTLTFESLGRSCPSLTSLSWNMHPAYHESVSGVDECRTISQHLPRLKQLEIAYLKNIETSIAYDIIRGCPELELLDLRGCWGVEVDKKWLEETRPGLEVLGPSVTGVTLAPLGLEDYSDLSDSSEFDEEGSLGFDDFSEFNEEGSLGFDDCDDDSSGFDEEGSLGFDVYDDDSSELDEEG